MVTLKTGDLSLEIEIEKLDFDPVEYTYKITPKWKGIPFLNDTALKRGNKYWDKGFNGGIIGGELDDFSLVEIMEKAIETKNVQKWIPYPDPDICVSIYPERCFPDLDKIDNEYFTLIFSPSIYQYSDSRNYDGFTGVSFIMTPTLFELKSFVSQFKAEYEYIKQN